MPFFAGGSGLNTKRGCRSIDKKLLEIVEDDLSDGDREHPLVFTVIILRRATDHRALNSQRPNQQRILRFVQSEPCEKAALDAYNVDRCVLPVREAAKREPT